MIKQLPKTVVLLSIVSFFTDFSSEMIYPLLPIFLSTVLGAGALALGMIEGIAESTAALLKVVSGIWADRTRRRKPFILAGYGIAGLVRPLIGLASIWPVVLLLRFTDRIGKGLRTSPRDALIADVTEPGQRGLAYGFHRSTDHAGAVLGPLVAAALLGFGSFSLRQVFLLSAIPAFVVVMVLVFGVKEAKPAPAPSSESTSRRLDLAAHWKDLGRNFKVLLVALLVFTLGNSTDAFLLLRLSDAGVPTSWIAILWSGHHVIKMFSTYYGGRLSDGVGARSMIIAGWIVYALIYLAFALVTSASSLIVIFLAYGIYFGLTEPAEKSWVVDLAPTHLRGTAFGYYHGIIGLGALPASLLFGLLWHSFGAPAAFITGAALALAASLVLLLVRSEPQEAHERKGLKAPAMVKLRIPSTKTARADFTEAIDE